MRQAIWNKNQTMPSQVLHKSLVKGGSVICRISYDQGEKFSPNRKPGGSKNVILCFLENIRYIREGICTGYITRCIHQYTRR